MVQPSQRITQFLIFFVLAIVIFKNLSGSGFFESKNYKAKGFQVRIPETWTRVPKQKGVEYPRGTDFVQLVPEGTDLKAGKPKAIISLLSKRLEAPIWIEDEFPNILQSLGESGYDVKDKGEIKLDDKISNWVVYYDRKNDLLVLEFYVVTDNGTFIKMQYSADPENFKIYRPYFEQLRESFKFRFSI